MSSAQGANSTTITPGYSYDADVVRDASDWTRQLKEKRAYYSYSPVKNTGNRDTGSEPWLKYGNQFRLTYAYGKFMCEPLCTGNAFGSVVGDNPPLPAILEGASILTNCSTSTFTCATSAEFGTYTTSAILAFQAPSTGVYTITYSGIGGALRSVPSTATAADYVTNTITSFTTGDTISLTYGDILYMFPAANNGDTLTVQICK